MSVVRKLRCRVARIMDHGDQVYTVELHSPQPVPVFRPGQFLHLALDEYDPSSFWPESRVFSIAGASPTRDRLRISYSVRGKFTARMAQELAADCMVWIKLPYGDFVVGRERNAVLVAGGTGITAYAAFLETLTADFPHDLTLLYGARNPRLLLYPDTIQRAQQALPRFRVYRFVEQDAGGELRHGRLSFESIWPELATPGATDFYLSGPPAMIRALSADLAQRGIGPGTIKIDAWE
jgi:NAD(P)H-flavin reductase